MYWSSPQLGAVDDFRSTVIKALAVFVGADKAALYYDQGIATIQANAGKGAEKAVKPYVIGAMALGGAGIVIGLTALIRSRKNRSRA